MRDYKKPVYQSTTLTFSGDASSETQDATLPGGVVEIGQIDTENIGGNLTIEDILIDGESLGNPGTPVTVNDVFGQPLRGETKISITASNSSSSAETIDIVIRGVEVS